MRGMRLADAGMTQAFNTLPLSLLEIRLSTIIPSTSLQRPAPAFIPLIHILKNKYNKYFISISSY